MIENKVGYVLYRVTLYDTRMSVEAMQAANMQISLISMLKSIGSDLKFFISIEIIRLPFSVLFFIVITPAHKFNFENIMDSNYGNYHA